MATFRARLTDRPEWPLVLVFCWYPLWWLLGVTQLVMLVACFVMAAALLRQRTLVLPRGLGWWLLFLAWVAVGFFVVKVDVPGALHVANNTRYLTWFLRLVWLLEATVVLLYVRNKQRGLSGERIARIFAVMFITIVVGGLLGTFFPTVQMQSLLELALPRHIAQAPFVSSLVHPYLAQMQTYGGVTYRPSGPFPYANDWGLNFACLLPFFVRAWLARDAGWRRPAGVIVLAASVVPVIYSLNRGLWAILILMVVVLVLVQARAGHYRSLAVCGAGLVVALSLVLVTPLGAVLSERFSGHNSNEGRANLYEITVDGMARSSPVIGDGTTRKAAGSFYSIAGGATPDCYTCSPPALGTQGFLWWILFATGFGGGLLVMAFLLSALWRYRSRGDPTRLACRCSLLAFVVALPIYDWTITSGIVAIAAIAVLDRESPGRVREMALPPRMPELALGKPVWALCLLTGLGLGAVWQLHHDTTYVARVSVYLPEDQTQSSRATTLDSEARFVDSPQVLESSAALRSLDRTRGRGQLQVEATANSRLLDLSYYSTDPGRAREVVDRVAASFVAAQTAGDSQAHAVTQSSIRRHLQGTLVAERSIAGMLRRLPGDSFSNVIVSTLVADLDQLRATDTAAATQLDGVDIAKAQSPQIESAPTVSPLPQQRNVALLSGLMIALVAACGLELLARRRGPRLSRADERRRRGLGLDLPVTTDAPLGLNVYLSADPTSPPLLAESRRLTERRSGPRPHARSVMLVAHHSTRVTTVVRTCDQLRSRGVPVSGVLVTHDLREEPAR